MKQITYLVMLLFLACCATTKPDKAENSVDIAGDTESSNDETIAAKIINDNNYFAEEADGKPFEPENFVRRHFAGNGMDVYRVFTESEIDFEKLIKLSGKEAGGRYYFAYQSPLYKKPVNGTDEMFMQFQHLELISRSLNNGYTLDLDVNIKNNQSGEFERRNLKLDVRPCLVISDYRREGTLKFTLKKEDGSYLYGMCYVASAIVTQDVEKANLYKALKAWLDQPENTDFPNLLFGELKRKKIN